jgi:hypothetical protein
LVLATATLAPFSCARPEQPAQDNLSAPTLPARAWAEQCAINEILVIQHPNSYLRYRLHEVNEKGEQVRDQIETPDGSVARLIQRDGRPLTPEEDVEERDRLNSLIESPWVFFHRVKGEQANKKLGIDLLKMMPDAMLWSYAAGQPQPLNQAGFDPGPSSEGSRSEGTGSTNQQLVVLDFKPNPDWSPPMIAAQPLTGLEGRIWIDRRTARMVHLEGDIFHAVNIGWGMVAHIYPGGTVTLHQVSAPSPPGVDRFIVDHIVERLTVRALMVKTVRQKVVFDTSDFRPVTPMSFQQAIKILLDTPLPSHP